MGKVIKLTPEKFVIPEDLTTLQIEDLPPFDELQADKAQEVAFDAMEANAKRALTLAKKALAISPWCADAYRIIAGHEKDLGRRAEILALGMKIGEKALGADFENFKGDFWGFIETRPYMRIKGALADCLGQLGDRDGQIRQYLEMLELNPNDNQGIRYVALTALIQAGLDDAAWKLYEQYRDDWSADWTYGRVLLDFRKHGSGPETEKSLVTAIECNPYAIKYLAKKRKLPKKWPDLYSPGDEREGIVTGLIQLPAWEATLGACEWLGERTPARSASAKQQKKG